MSNDEGDESEVEEMELVNMEDHAFPDEFVVRDTAGKLLLSGRRTTRTSRPLRARRTRRDPIIRGC